MYAGNLIDDSFEEYKWQIRRFRHLMPYGIKPDVVEEKLYKTAGYLDELSLHTAVLKTPESVIFHAYS